ncbi:hypothetical protein V6N13_009577 [Hibiscus sabdariffa]|uniref:Uncharacterized protein n=2 Tax=Hibiscus sabdariffa TaxID=183260 RepID=A0ABR2NNI1_9ROSI
MTYGGYAPGYEYRRVKVGDQERGICEFVGRVNDVLIANQGAVAINGGSLRSTSTGQQRACGSNAETYNVRFVSTGLQNGDVRGAGGLQLYADAVLPLDTAPVNHHQ